MDVSSTVKDTATLSMFVKAVVCTSAFLRRVGFFETKSGTEFLTSTFDEQTYWQQSVGYVVVFTMKEMKRASHIQSRIRAYISD